MNFLFFQFIQIMCYFSDYENWSLAEQFQHGCTSPPKGREFFDVGAEGKQEPREPRNCGPIPGSGQQILTAQCVDWL
jgi:hypothetical protein